jgi:hypothetical protein
VLHPRDGGGGTSSCLKLYGASWLYSNPNCYIVQFNFPNVPVTYFGMLTCYAILKSQFIISPATMERPKLIMVPTSTYSLRRFSLCRAKRMMLFPIIRKPIASYWPSNTKVKMIRLNCPIIRPPRATSSPVLLSVLGETILGSANLIRYPRGQNIRLKPNIRRLLGANLSVDFMRQFWNCARLLCPENLVSRHPLPEIELG